MKQCIRIIGGLYRGKKLSFPDIEGLRPTPDRVRETLFNWLMHDIRGAHCLDAFAGSGALGLEAFSRGAAAVTLLEYSAIAYAHLQKTSALFNSPNLKTIKTDALTHLQQCKERYDLIFLDPPFAKDLLHPCLAAIAKNKMLNKGGYVYLESGKELDLDTNLWQPIKLKKAGQVTYGLFELKLKE